MENSKNSYNQIEQGQSEDYNINVIRINIPDDKIESEKQIKLFSIPIPMEEETLNELTEIKTSHEIHPKISLLVPDSSPYRESSRDRSDFMNSWKMEIGLGILFAEKVALIVQNYFRMLPEINKRMEEVEILIIYNKGLLEILNKFEDYEQKILIKLKTVEEFNLKLMKELCSIKSKPFKPPEIKVHDSLFSKFSLKDLKYSPGEKEEETIEISYKHKLKNIFKEHFMNKSIPFLGKVEQKIEHYEKQHRSLTVEDHLESLRELENNIQTYNESIKDISIENMFDMYELKQRILTDLKELDIHKDDDELEELGEKKFVAEIAKIHAELTKMEESQIVEWLKSEKDKKRKLKKQRIEEQEKFLRQCEKVETVNVDLKKDLAMEKERVLKLDAELKRLQGELEFKQMKQRVNKSNLDETVLTDDNKSVHTKKFQKETQKIIENDLKKMKEENEKLSKKIAEYTLKEQILERVKQRASAMKIGVDPKWEEDKIIEFLLNKIKNPTKSLSVELAREDDILSPQLSEPFTINFEDNGQFLGSIPERVEFDDIETKNKDLEKDLLLIQRKYDEAKRQIKNKDEMIKRLLEENEKMMKKNAKINKLVKEYETYQTEIKELRLENQLLKIKNELAEKLSDNVIESFESCKSMNRNPDKLLKGFDKLIKNLKDLVSQYKDDLRKEEEIFEENILISVHAGETSFSKIGVNYIDQSQISLRSHLTKPKEKYNDKDEKVKRMKSLTDSFHDKEKLFPKKARTTKKIEKESNLEKKVNFEQIPSPRSASKEYRKDEFSFESERNQTFRGDKKSSFFETKNEKEISPKYQTVVMEKLKEGSQSLYKDARSENHHEEEPRMDNLLGFLDHNYSESNHHDNEMKSEKSRMRQTEDARENFDKNQDEEKKLNLSKLNLSRLSNLNMSKLSSKNDNLLKVESKKEGDEKVEEEDQFEQTAKYGNDESESEKSEGKNKNKESVQNIEESFTKKDQDKKNRSMVVPENTQMSLKIIKKHSQDNYNEEDKKLPGMPTFLDESIDSFQIIEHEKKEKSDQYLESHGVSSHLGDPSEPVIRINNVTGSEISDSIVIGKNSGRLEVGEKNSEEEFNLSYSKISRDGSIHQKKPVEELKQGLKSRSHSKITVRYEHSKLHSLSMNGSNASKINSVAPDPEFEERIMGIIEKNQKDERDALDFYELYERYKDALSCLQTSEEQNRRQELKYQKFISSLRSKKVSNNEQRDYEEELCYLNRLVEEQKLQIEEEDRKFNESISKHIKTSESLIYKQLKLMREDPNMSMKEPKRKFF